MNHIHAKLSILSFLWTVMIAFGDDSPQEWGLIKGGAITGEFVRAYDETLELRAEDGQVKQVDINTLSLEYIRFLIPTISQDEIDRPIQHLKGLYSSTREKEYLLKRGRFFDMGRGRYGRLLAFERGVYYFEDISGEIFSWEERYVSRMRGLSDYLTSCQKQIPEKLNVIRLASIIAAWKEDQRFKNLENRVIAAEKAANEALRQQNNQPNNRLLPAYR